MIATGYDGCTTLSANDIHSNIAAGIRAIAKLTKVIVSPALHTAFRRNGTGMCDASRDRVWLTTGHWDNASKGR